MSELIERLAHCIEFGKINKASPYPPEMKEEDGADELTRQALDEGISPQDLLSNAFEVGMERVGKKFAENKVFVPQLLMSAKAMNTAMEHIKPFFRAGNVRRKGVFIIGTIKGDLHDIGKNLVAMMVEGSGWEVIDLGVDVSKEKIMEQLDQHPGAAVGMSALLTTTMVNMENSVKEIKEKYPGTRILVGGAPLTMDYCKKIGADFYSPDPQGAVEYLNA
ncbi:MAG: corrinoid protein [Bacteroidales bacterium]|nr:MAG: corrinoid protein [Bacteroidales bacterium]